MIMFMIMSMIVIISIIIIIIIVIVTSGEAFAEYRLPLHPESGAWTDLARWAEEFDVK